MAFDKNLDQEIFSETANFETTRIKVGIYSYNEGEKKLQLSRENMSKKGYEGETSGDKAWTFAKLGRMDKEEVEAVLPMIKKALENM